MNRKEYENRKEVIEKKIKELEGEMSKIDYEFLKTPPKLRKATVADVKHGVTIWQEHDTDPYYLRVVDISLGAGFYKSMCGDKTFICEKSFVEI